MVYAHTIAGNPLAARFTYPAVGGAVQWAVAMLSNKLNAYLRFNMTYPGYGGFIPWFYANETDMRPTTDWEHRVPALDNGFVVSNSVRVTLNRIVSSSGLSMLPSGSFAKQMLLNTVSWVIHGKSGLIIRK
jgi:hypothetical protein